MEVTIRRVEFYEINQVVSFLIEQFKDIFLTQLSHNEKPNNPLM